MPMNGLTILLAAMDVQAASNTTGSAITYVTSQHKKIDFNNF